MLKKLRLVHIYTRRLSFRWVLVCMAIILPINVLAVVYSVTLYRNYQEKINVDHQVQLAGFATEISGELNRVSQALTYYFSTDVFGNYLISPSKDPSVVAVACKNLVSHIQDNRGIGMSFAWDHTNDVVYIFQNNQHYSAQTQAAFEAMIRNDNFLEGSYSQIRNAVSVPDALFLGVTHHIRHFSIGIYTDVSRYIGRYAAFLSEPKGILGITDSQGHVLSAWQDHEKVENLSRIQEEEPNAMIIQPLDFDGFCLFHQLSNVSGSKVFGRLPLVFWLLIAFTLICFTAMPLIFILSDRILIRPVSRLLGAMDELGKGNLDIRLPESASTVDVAYMNKGFNRMAEEIKTLRIRTYEQEIEKLQTEAINLKLQVNPHMFLNSLNTIYSLSRVGKMKELCDFSVLLMQYFRYSFRSNEEFSSVKEEMDFVTSYMKIQSMRYPDRFSFSFGMDAEAETIQIPRFIIENFAENTVKYALKSEKETEIIIQVRAQDNRLFISIVDDGCGMDEATLQTIQSGEVLEDNSGRHTGIWNSRRRLDFYYGKDYELSITSLLGKGTQVYLSLPMKMPDKADGLLHH